MDLFEIDLGRGSIRQRWQHVGGVTRGSATGKLLFRGAFWCLGTIPSGQDEVVIEVGESISSCTVHDIVRDSSLRARRTETRCARRSVAKEGATGHLRAKGRRARLAPSTTGATTEPDTTRHLWSQHALTPCTRTLASASTWKLSPRMAQIRIWCR